MKATTTRITGEAILPEIAKHVPQELSSNSTKQVQESRS
jgi:hypothetical protein